MLLKGTSSYKIYVDGKWFWENDFSLAKKIYEKYIKQKKKVKLILEQWEGEIGGDGEFSEDILFESN